MSTTSFVVDISEGAGCGGACRETRRAGQLTHAPRPAAGCVCVTKSQRERSAAVHFQRPVSEGGEVAVTHSGRTSSRSDATGIWITATIVDAPAPPSISDIPIDRGARIRSARERAAFPSLESRAAALQRNARAADARSEDRVSGAPAPRTGSDGLIWSKTLLQIASATSARAGWIRSEAEEPHRARRPRLCRPAHQPPRSFAGEKFGRLACAMRGGRLGNRPSSTRAATSTIRPPVR